MEFGFFTVQYNEQQKEVFYELLNSDFINVFLVGDKENGFSENSRKSFEEIHKAGKKCFVYFYDMTFVYTDGQAYVDVGEEFSQGPRTVIRKADVYVFDDSFSALDFLTESIIKKSLIKRLEGKTQITITQRVSTAMCAERIFVMDKGKIVAVGTHNELIEGCDIYREICISQLGKNSVGGKS